VWLHGGVPRDLTERSLTEWVVLGLLAEGPCHGFALARLLRRGGDVGRVWAVSRLLTYRAIDQLVADGLAEAVGTEAGHGPPRTVHRATTAGRRALRRWLAAPVAHFRDVRAELLVKLLLLERTGKPTAPLLALQLETFADALAAARLAPGTDAVSTWRRAQAGAIEQFLTNS
jgi:DNA-binding PadR family transcriptional regulator